jgi:DNA modification methylase
MKDLKIVYINIDKLKPAEYNPRKADQKQIDDIKKSIQRFGLVDPLIVNSAKERKNIVIGGHLRLKVAKDMGYKEVPCVFVNIPDVEKEKELNLRLNRNLGNWDYDLLANFDENFLLDVGFLNEELTDIFDLETQDDNFDFEKEVEQIEEPKTKMGDLYQLGEHYLLCGDSTKIEDVEKLMKGQKCNIVITDPPYNIGLDYSKTLTSGKKVSYDKKINDNKSVEDYEKFINKLIINSLAVCNQDAHIFYWCDEKYIWLFQRLFLENNIKLQRVCLWIKNNFTLTPQNAFNKVYEPCIYGTIGKPVLNKNIKNLTEILNKNLQKLDDIKDYFIDGLNLWLVDRENTSNYQHTTQKPITLLEKPIKRCSNVGDIVLDLCGGSGTTLLACEQLKRKCYMIEYNETYCDVICERFEKFTGKKRKKIEI